MIEHKKEISAGLPPSRHPKTIAGIVLIVIGLLFLMNLFRTSTSSWKIRMFHQKNTLLISPCHHNGLLVHHRTITDSCL
jgi:cytochrome c biogenesis protein CcdA